MKKLVLAAFVSVVAVSPALAGSCPSIIAEIDAAMATSTASEADKAAAMALRDEGATLHGQGNHGDSIAALNNAKALLGL